MALQSAGMVEHTLIVRETANTVLNSLVDAETGQRGYLLTGDPPFLEPYDRALVELVMPKIEDTSARASVALALVGVAAQRDARISHERR